MSSRGGIGCSALLLVGLGIVEEEVVGAATEADDGARVFQSLTVQSSDVERTRSPRSTGPRAGWKSRDMTGAVCPR